MLTVTIKTVANSLHLRFENRKRNIMFKKIGVLLLTALIMLMSGCANKVEKNEKLVVYTSSFVMYDFASKIGGDKVMVVNMIPDGAHVHDWEPEASDMMKLEGADVFIYNGAGLEHWVDDVLASINTKHLVVVNTSSSLKILQDTDHELDPHTYLDPNNAKIQLAEIRDALIKANPENTNYFNDNYNFYEQKLTDLDVLYKTQLESVSKRDLVVSHAAFGYLATTYGLKQYSIAGLSGEQEPSAARMAEIIDFIRSNNVTTIFSEQGDTSKIVDTISKETGVKCAVLSPIESLTKAQIIAGDDYFSLMESNLAAIMAALK